MSGKEEEQSKTESLTMEETHGSSAVVESCNPFAERHGKTLTWNDVTMTVTDKTDKSKKPILESVWGQASNEVTAIMGPSGAGKTSLLNILAGRIRKSKHTKISANIHLDGERVKPSTDLRVRRQIAFVEQFEHLHIAATPRESIYFSAKLRLPSSTSDKQLEEITASMIKELGLQNCADTVIGGARLKGISGGERKRTAVGVEIVVRPSILMLDEATSGLDYFSALQLVKVLQKVARAGATVLLTIHQPSSDIFNMFDQMILMNKGRVMFQGTPDQVPDYFEQRGHPLPPRFNPADWVMIVAQTVSIKELDEANYFQCISSNKQKQVLERLSSRSMGKSDISSIDDSNQYGSDHVGIWTEIYCMGVRDYHSLHRNKLILGARLAMTSFIALLTGCIFWQAADSDPSNPAYLNGHFGCIIIATMASMLSTALPTLLVFPEERPVFVREYSTYHYRVFSYFCARLGLEAFLTLIQMGLLSFLTYFMMGFQLNFGQLFAILYTLGMSSTSIAMLIGSSVENPEIAVEFLPMTFIPQILFAGFFVAPEQIPSWLRWLQYAFPYTYGVRIFVAIEFDRDCGNALQNGACENLMETVRADPDDVWWYWIALLGIFFTFRLVGLRALKVKADSL